MLKPITKMRKLIIAMIVLMAILLAAMPAFTQALKPVPKSYKYEVMLGATVTGIGIYGLNKDVKVLPAVIGSGFIYGGLKMRKDGENMWGLPILAGIGCFLIQGFVVKPKY